MKPAALYLRSSKDRSDVSIASQRRELTALAQRDGYTIVAEYVDTVESAKDEHRPDFQRLLQAFGDPHRGWEAVLAIDTSRISRRRFFAHSFRHEAEKRGIEIVYAKVPQDLDPVSDVIIHSTMVAMDEVHSIMSKQKGLAGMAENVRSGWRAGGRAPFGYRLATIGTGSYREGREVTKTRLEPDENAGRARRYLQGRAAGETRRQATEAAGIRRSPSSLIGIEWNALTYAGATVWNVHAERLPGGGYVGGHKRRPREDWLIQRDTHPALIDWDEAEAILARLQDSVVGRAISEAKSGNSPYLLTGLLVTPSGDAWCGHNRTHYRIKANRGERRGRTIRCAPVDELVTAQIADDIQTRGLAHDLADSLQSQPQHTGPDTADLHARVVQINETIARTLEHADALDDPAPAYRRIDGLERERRELSEEIQRIEADREAQNALSQITESEIQDVLADAWATLRQADPQRLKPALRSLIDHVELDPETLETTIHYRLATEKWLSMASPRGFEPLLPP